MMSEGMRTLTPLFIVPVGMKDRCEKKMEFLSG
jgi:hypothetical protein